VSGRVGKISRTNEATFEATLNHYSNLSASSPAEVRLLNISKGNSVNVFNRNQIMKSASLSKSRSRDGTKSRERGRECGGASVESRGNSIHTPKKWWGGRGPGE